jgi:hypothetical protein
MQAWWALQWLLGRCVVIAGQQKGCWGVIENGIPSSLLTILLLLYGGCIFFARPCAASCAPWFCVLCAGPPVHLHRAAAVCDVRVTRKGGPPDPYDEVCTAAPAAVTGFALLAARHVAVQTNALSLPRCVSSRVGGLLMCAALMPCHAPCCLALITLPSPSHTPNHPPPSPAAGCRV